MQTAREREGLALSELGPREGQEVQCPLPHAHLPLPERPPLLGTELEILPFQMSAGFGREAPG